MISFTAYENAKRDLLRAEKQTKTAIIDLQEALTRLESTQNTLVSVSKRVSEVIKVLPDIVGE